MLCSLNQWYQHRRTQSHRNRETLARFPPLYEGTDCRISPRLRSTDSWYSSPVVDLSPTTTSPDLNNILSREQNMSDIIKICPKCTLSSTQQHLVVKFILRPSSVKIAKCFCLVSLCHSARKNGNIMNAGNVSTAILVVKILRFKNMLCWWNFPFIKTAKLVISSSV